MKARTKRMLRGTLAMVATASIVAACGSDDDATSPTSEGTSASEPPSSATLSTATPPPETTADATMAPPSSVQAAAPTSAVSPSETVPDEAFAELVEAAEAEGHLVVYTAFTTDIAERIAGAFETKYPDIDVEMVRSATGETVTRLDTERAQGIDGADVAIHTAGAWFAATEEAGELLALGDLPSSAGWGEVEQFSEHYFPAQFVPFVLAWNTQFITDPPQSYGDLLNEEYSGGLIATGDPQASPVGYAFYRALDEQNGDDFVERLGQQGVRIYQSSDPLSQALAAGEATVAAFAIQGNIALQRASGAPVDFLVPEPAIATPMWAGGVGWSTRPNASMVFLDFLMSPEGQIAVNGDEIGISALGADAVPSSVDRDVTLLNPAAFDQAEIDEGSARYAELLRANSAP